LNGGEQHADQDSNDGNDDEKLNERKRRSGAILPFHGRPRLLVN
jgi:hypothetical protein